MFIGKLEGLLEVKSVAGRWKLVTGCWRRDTRYKMMPAAGTLSVTGERQARPMGARGLRSLINYDVANGEHLL